MEASYYARKKNDAAQCFLCHHRCLIQNGAAGLCRVRRNDSGILMLPFYGALSALAVDPMEKKPLYHFMPGTRTYSAGYVSCNLRCPFCQNYSISQRSDINVRRVSPAELADMALRSGCPSVSHTYSEPLVHAEFLTASMRESKKRGLANVLVTNGCAETEAARDVLSLCDAVNVDIKTWNAALYRGELGGELDTVMRFTETALNLGVHVELTTLVIPSKNDSAEEIDAIAAWIASLSKDIPYHLSAYRPMFRCTIPPTPPETLRNLVSLAQRRLQRVYAGNVV